MSYLERLKRKLPLTAVKALEIENNPNFKRIVAMEGEDFLVRFEEPYDYSDFFFEVVRFRSSDKGAGFDCRWSPRHAGNTDEYKVWLKLESFKDAIDRWADNVAGYHATKNTPFDDPIEKAHKEWFSQQIQLVDANSEEPFAVNQILLILEHYEKLQGELLKLEGVPEEEIEELVQEIEKEKRMLGSSGKGESFDSMLTIWARIAKKYPTVIKFVVDTFHAWGLGKVFDSVFQGIGEG